MKHHQMRQSFFAVILVLVMFLLYVFAENKFLEDRSGFGERGGGVPCNADSALADREGNRQENQLRRAEGRNFGQQRNAQLGSY